MMMSTTLDKALDMLEELSLDDQEMVLDIMKRRLHERSRTQMLAQAKETSAAYRQGELETQSASDFLQEINASR
jgi:hypothetical protein